MPCSREEVLTIFQSADKDGSGMLSIKEFKKSNKGRFIMSKSLFLIFKQLNLHGIFPFFTKFSYFFLKYCMYVFVLSSNESAQSTLTFRVSRHERQDNCCLVSREQVYKKGNNLFPSLFYFYN